MTSFIPHTPEEREQMLKTIGVPSMEALFDGVSSALKTGFSVETLPAQGKTELELQQHLTHMAQQNSGAVMESFLGGGAYARFIPPAVNSIASRSEFYTAYTPYQPEISQGTLQMIYEFQTMISELTGMDVTNASVYDGATAMCEAAFMAVRATRRKIIYLSQTANPHYQRVLETYVQAMGELEIHLFDPNQAFASQAQDDPKKIAAILIQQPDYLGAVHDLTAYQRFCEDSGALFVVGVDPVTLAILEPPRTYGAHIVCGDIQQFGNSINYGGPYGGFLSTTEKLMRQLPGRVVGRSLDKEGQVAYTLTLQTREQHIRRAKATSNICTNQSLNVLKATVYMSLVGPQGLQQIASLSTQRAHLLAESLLSLPGVSMRFENPFLYEFALCLPIPAQTMIEQMALHHGILAGIDVGKYWPGESQTLLVAVTEMNSLESIHRYIDAFKKILHNKGISVLPTQLRRETAMVCTGTLGRTI